MKHEDIAYIFAHADADAIIVDTEFLPLLDSYGQANPRTPFIVDEDTDATEGELSGQFDEAVLEGLKYDAEQGGRGWVGLEAQVGNEEDIIALAYTSGTTAKPKGVEYTHRGCYVAALGNVIESGLNYHTGRCRYLWTLPMFHAMGWTFPWAVTAVRGTHYCLRKIDYPEIWRLLRDEHITHYNAAPTVNTLLCAAKEAVRLPEPVRVTVAASPPTAHLFEQMTNLNLHPVHVYGLTETYGPITKGYVRILGVHLFCFEFLFRFLNSSCDHTDLSFPFRYSRDVLKLIQMMLTLKSRTAYATMGATPKRTEIPENGSARPWIRDKLADSCHQNRYG